MTSVRSRILLFFTLFAVASFMAVYMSGRSTGVVGHAANSIVNLHLPIVHALGQLEVAIERHDNSVYRYLFSGDKAWLDECENQRVAYHKWFSELKRWTTEPLEQERLQEIDELYVQYDNETRHLLLNPQRATTRAELRWKQSERYLSKIQMLLDDMESFRMGMTVERRVQISDTLARHQRGAFYFLVTIAFFFVLLALYLWRFLVNPLTLLLNGIRDFTRGKTDVQIPPVGKDELGELQEAFNEMSREIDLERKKLQTESQSDPLTGLFNMRYFRLQLADEFSRSQRYGRPLTLIMIDVDHFKLYNDRNGHPAGDIVLKEIARILIRNVRGTDIVARYGGEEFVILLPETPMEAAINVAQKILRTVEEHHFPFVGNRNEERLTVSLGVASYPDGHITSDQDLIEASDKALYAAKKNGRNQVWLFSKGTTITASITQKTSHSASALL